MPRRGPGIARTAAKTAVIAGTATATAGAVHHAMSGGKQPPEQPPASAPAPGPAPAGMTQNQIDRLKQLAQLKESGVLTDAEFQAEKQRILAS